MRTRGTTFAEVGEIFNDATTKLVGGISNQNRADVLSDLAHVQKGLTDLISHNPADFAGVAGIHAQNIIDQLNLEIAAVKTAGTDPFAAKYINDVQRDLIDIVQGDDQLVALATAGGHNGFAAVPDLLVAPAQFRGSDEQTQFMQGFVATTQGFAERVNVLAGQPGDAPAVQQLVGEVQAYAQHANQFTMEQGGLYSARFDNEFAANGVNGTASRALIDGLQTGNTGKVQAAAEVLVANSNDVASNMLGIGDDPPPVTGNGIPDQITTVAEAGTVFNDATAKLIGGVYAGNRQSIHDDLAATQKGLQDMVANGQLNGTAATHAGRVADIIGRELRIIDNVDAGPNAAARINQLHSRVIDIVHKDAVLAAAANDDGANGFMQLPGTLQQGNHGGHRGNATCQDGSKAAPAAVAASHAGGMDVAGLTAPADHLAQIFDAAGLHHAG